jgi:hypothetical protein
LFGILFIVGFFAPVLLLGLLGIVDIDELPRSRDIPWYFSLAMLAWSGGVCIPVAGAICKKLDNLAKKRLERRSA